MESAFSRLDGGELVGLIVSLTALVCVATVIITAVVAPQWRRVRQTEAETRLKGELVAAGYAAEDIERIVRASAQSPLPRRSEAAYAYRR
jgi:hypothetical protein